MLLIMVLGFGVVIAVNLVMARFALSTFGGTVVDNSYIASQRYNQWLARARKQQALGWTTRFTLDRERRVEIVTDAGAGAVVTGVASHPLGRAPDVVLAFDALGEGRYRARTSLPDGRWAIHLVIRHAQDEARLIETLG